MLSELVPIELEGIVPHRILRVLATSFYGEGRYRRLSDSEILSGYVFVMVAIFSYGQDTTNVALSAFIVRHRGSLSSFFDYHSNHRGTEHLLRNAALGCPTSLEWLTVYFILPHMLQTTIS